MKGHADPWLGWRRPIEAWALAAMGTGLCLLTLALLLVPQRLAQRPASQGIVSLRLAPDGQVWIWNQPIQGERLITALRRLEATARRPTVRVIPDPDVPWGSVRQLVGKLNRLDLPLELQLP